MRIALFHNQSAGGAKRVIFEHARQLRERGHTFDAYIVSTATEAYLPLAPLCDRIYTYDPSAGGAGTPGRLAAHPLVQRAFRSLGRAGLADRSADLARVDGHLQELEAIGRLYEQMAADMNRGGYDVAYVHQCRTSISPGLLRRLSFPSVYYCHDTLRYVHEWAFEEHGEYDALEETRYWSKMKGNLVPQPMMRFLNTLEQQFVAATRAATVVLCNSWFSREAILRTTGTNPRVCYPAVDATYFCPDPGVGRERTVLSVGTLAQNKRHDFIVEAVATIPAGRRPPVEIVGYEIAYGEAELGPYARKLRALAAARGVELRITKEVSDEVLRDRYRRAAAFAFAPALEPFGIVPLEAMACGTPVVGVSEGGLRETIQDGVTGFLTERDPVEFGAALDRLISDPHLAATVGRRGREDASTRWTWSRSADRLEGELKAAVLAAVARANRIEYGSGFHALEQDAQGSSWRWMEGEGVVTVGNPRRDMRLTIDARVPPFLDPSTLTVEFNGRLLDRMRSADGAIQKTVTVPASAQHDQTRSQIRFIIDKTFVPHERDPASEDRRHLGLTLHRLAWEPVE